MNATEQHLTDARTPVTVWLSPAQAAQLELMLADAREANPGTDDNALCDEIFALGMNAINGDLLAVTGRAVAAISPYPITAPDAIRHLQELMVGAGACLAIDGEDVLVEVVMEPAGESINVLPEELVELVDALTVIQNLREAE